MDVKLFKEGAVVSLLVGAFRAASFSRGPYKNAAQNILVRASTRDPRRFHKNKLRATTVPPRLTAILSHKCRP